MTRTLSPNILIKALLNSPQEFVKFAAKRKAAYYYTDIYNCPIAQYLKAYGVKKPEVSPSTVIADGKRFNIPEWLDEVARGQPILGSPKSFNEAKTWVGINARLKLEPWK